MTLRESKASFAIEGEADRVLRSIERNRGELSNALAKQMPVLREPDVWAEIIKAVSLAFQEDPPADRYILDRYHPARPAGGES